MKWTEINIAHLRALWQEGHSIAEIGRRLGVTKSATASKARGLNPPLQNRPSPIRRDCPPPVPRAPRAGLHTLPTLPSLAGKR